MLSLLWVLLRVAFGICHGCTVGGLCLCKFRFGGDVGGLGSEFGVVALWCCVFGGDCVVVVVVALLLVGGFLIVYYYGW